MPTPPRDQFLDLPEGDPLSTEHLDEKVQQAEQQETQRKLAEMQVRQAMNTQDNLTAMELAQLEVETGERFSVSTGTGINP